jgi:alginate O-acetyltransferase complex protein AlgI
MLQVIVTFGLVCIGWIFFRAQNLNDAFYILGHFWTNWDFRAIGTEQFLLRQMPVAIAAIAILEIGQFLHGRVSFSSLTIRVPMVVRWTGYAAFMMAVVLFGVYRETQFIYFQF